MRAGEVGIEIDLALVLEAQRQIAGCGALSSRGRHRREDEEISCLVVASFASS